IICTKNTPSVSKISLPLHMTSMLNPSVCSLMLAATSPFRGDIWYRKVLTFVSCELYMLPERELAKSRSDFD
ncbi:hypothetical protein, partial [Phascolarctobacterium succinatutens]|uniref:hypothetical protein n=1 Tax=Phascolarctobacterium succinatutens TaxID=626940 RepID=UPI0026EAB055